MDLKSSDELASMQYMQWQDLYTREKPFQVFANVPPGSTERLTNLVFGPSPPLEIRNLRGREDDSTLDGNGFQVVHDQMPDFNLNDRKTVEGDVAAYFEGLVRTCVDGADFVRCFDYGSRKNVRMTMPEMAVNDKMQVLHPGKQAHCGECLHRSLCMPIDVIELTRINAKTKALLVLSAGFNIMLRRWQARLIA